MNVVNVAKGVWGLVDHKLKQIHRIASIENIAWQIAYKGIDKICADLLWGLVVNEMFSALKELYKMK